MKISPACMPSVERRAWCSRNDAHHHHPVLILLVISRGSPQEGTRLTLQIRDHLGSSKRQGEPSTLVGTACSLADWALLRLNVSPGFLWVQDPGSRHTHATPSTSHLYIRHLTEAI